MFRGVSMNANETPLQPRNLHRDDKNKQSQNAKHNVTLQQVALSLLSAGFSVLPCHHHDMYLSGGTPKKPTVKTWTPYQKKLMPAAEVQKHFVPDVSIGVVCGRVSGNLECLDFDDPELYQPFPKYDTI